MYKLNGPKITDQEEIWSLVEAARAGDMDAKGLLVESQSRLAATIIKENSYSFPLEDNWIWNVSTSAIMETIDHWDRSRGAFSTCLKQYIMQQVQKLSSKVRSRRRLLDIGSECLRHKPLDLSPDLMCLKLIDMAVDNICSNIRKYDVRSCSCSYCRNYATNKMGKVHLMSKLGYESMRVHGKYGTSNGKTLGQIRDELGLKIAETNASWHRFRLMKAVRIELERLGYVYNDGKLTIST